MLHNVPIPVMPVRSLQTVFKMW